MVHSFVKGGVRMEWLTNMNRAIEYIEKNLCGKIDYEKTAREACCSVYHFQRMFTFMTNITLSEYSVSPCMNSQLCSSF